MLEHKQYECEHCGAEFDHDEYEEAVRHETNCDCNPAFKRCGSCSEGKMVTSYECEFIRCNRLRQMNSKEKCWSSK